MKIVTYNGITKRRKAQEIPSIGILPGIPRVPLYMQVVTFEFDLRSIWKKWRLFTYIEAFWSGSVSLFGIKYSVCNIICNFIFWVIEE